MFSKFFIQRPIFATVIAVLMVLAGLLTVFTLPIAQYPDITPPTIMVSASYAGADASTVAQTVGVPIEQQVNGVEGMLYMSSTSGSDGSYNLTMTFENGTDIDQAAVNVQNKISQIQSTLPSSVTRNGVSVSKQSSNNVLFVALMAKDPKMYDALYLSNYAQLNIVEPLSRVKGVGGVGAFGGGEYSMRIWLDPEVLRARGLTPADVAEALRAQNVTVSAGSVGAPPEDKGNAFQYTIVSDGQLKDVEQFENAIIKTGNKGILRLKDIARVELGSNSYSAVAKINGQDAGLIGVEQLPGANALEVADGAIKELDRLSQYFPDGVEYKVVQNSTDFVKASLNDVKSTFLITTLIVMVVILIFLQDWRAVIIPMITIPVSLIATFAVMKILGFSLNTLTLFGLVLAIAIVVDDAIVVVEDCSRILNQGQLDRKQAAIKAMGELTGPIVGEVLVLLSVFIPTAFISGITGELYKQFALTIAVSTAFSGFNALTLTPALCGLFLNPRKPGKFFIYRWFNKGFGTTLSFYKKTILVMLRKPVVAMGVFLLLSIAAIWGFMKWPSSYIPQEDMGYFLTSVQLPVGASLERTQRVVDRVSAEIQKLPEVKDVMSISGFSFMAGGSGSNLGAINVMLKHWSERGRKGSVDNVIAKVNEITAKVQEAEIFSINPPAIPGLGVSSGLQMQLLDINNLGPIEMEKALADIREAAAKDNRISSVTSMYEGTVPQYNLKIDRDKARLQGLTPEALYAALAGYMGSEFVDDFEQFDRMYEVTLQANAGTRSNINGILQLSVRNNDGKMVPFSSFATIENMMGEPSVSRYNMYQTASLTATPAKGVSSDDGIKAMEEIVREAVGKNFSYAWSGIAYQETQSSTTISFVLILAIVMTLLVLSAQYESWTDPIAVILSMPVAVLGTLLGCILFGQSISIYTQIGLILLLGMSAKNSILIVEYAMDFRKTGVPIRKAAADAGVIRFRPIMMTAFAFVFGVMPMMFATGAGAESRRELGTAVVFGMFLNAIIGTLFVPNFWETMQTISEKYLSKILKPLKPSGKATGTEEDQLPTDI